MGKPSGKKFRVLEKLTYFDLVTRHQSPFESELL
jgi:hypothetical protein